MSPLRISLEMPPNEHDRVRLADALLDHSRARFGDPTATPIGFFLRDDGGELCGGLTGNLRWRWLYVDMLWVRGDLRNLGYGSRLLSEAEDFARASGGVAVHLDTGGDEALPFYLKRGYVVFGTLEGFPPGAKQYFLQKHL
ncbi:MAG TPA: GNAT family N-acetyltransferase, partial [Vicinamibacteria bacterium]